MIDYQNIPSASGHEAGPVDELRDAIITISRRFGSVGPQQISATPVTRFRASYAQVLKEVDRGQPQVVVQGSKRFVVFSEEQVLAFADLHDKDQTVGDLLQGLPLLDRQTAPIRVDTPEPTRDQYTFGDRA